MLMRVRSHTMIRAILLRRTQTSIVIKYLFYCIHYCFKGTMLLDIAVLRLIMHDEVVVHKVEAI